MDILIFMALGAAIGFIGGMIVGRWAHKRDRLNRLNIVGFDRASSEGSCGVAQIRRTDGTLVQVLKI